MSGKMTDVRTLAAERTEIMTDVLNGRIPKRVPICATLQYEFAIEFAGKSLFDAQWNSEQFEAISEVVCQNFYSDVFPVMSLRFPALYRILGARNWRMGSQGFIQHPDVEGLAVDEYDEFITSPLNCIMEKVMPRLYTELDTDPVTRSQVLAKAFKCFFDEMGNVGMATAKLSQKYGYAQANFFAGACSAPFDFVGDQFRGFTRFVKDVRRMPDKVKAAVEAVTPLMIKMGTPAVPAPNALVFIPLHMAPFLRTKDFAELYWPTFKQLVEAIDAAGYKSFLFVEQDWMRYLDYLAELPENTVMWFEYGDPKLTKERIGNKHILSGFYPVTLLKAGTKEQCLDKAKEMLDILAPGGRSLFFFDKSPITLNSTNVDNLKAVLNYVAENANY